MQLPKVRRIRHADPHEDQKWFILEGYVEGCEQVTKRASIAVSALVTRPQLKAEAEAKLLADVAEYYANWLYLQSQ